MLDNVEVNIPHGLTKDDLAALKKADRIIFQHYDGYSRIRAVKDANRDGPFTGEAEREIKTGFRLIDYSGHGGDRRFSREDAREGRFAAFDMSWGDEATQTAMGLLRAGDFLKLEWSADAGTSDYLRAVDYHCDRLALKVYRGKKVLTFLLSTQAGPDNTARMIRKA